MIFLNFGDPKLFLITVRFVVFFFQCASIMALSSQDLTPKSACDLVPSGWGPHVGDGGDGHFRRMIKGDLPGLPVRMGPPYGKREPYKLPISFKDSYGSDMRIGDRWGIPPFIGAPWKSHWDDTSDCGVFCCVVLWYIFFNNERWWQTMISSQSFHSIISLKYITARFQ